MKYTLNAKCTAKGAAESGVVSSMTADHFNPEVVDTLVPYLARHVSRYDMVTWSIVDEDGIVYDYGVLSKNDPVC